MKVIILKAAIQFVLTFAAWAANVITAHGQVCEAKAGSNGGTAFCVSTPQKNISLFVTAGHLAQNSRTVQIAPDGQWHQARVLFSFSSGAGRDLALLECTTYVPKQPYVLSPTSPQIGEKVTFAGYPGGRELRGTQAVVVTHQRGFMVLSRASIPGESGGPVINAQGRVVGIITHTDDRISYATNAETIASTWDRWARGETIAPASVGIGVGFGWDCGPRGCYPQPYGSPYGAVPQQPYGVPQAPGYPGLVPAEPPRTLPENPVPTPPTPPAVIPDSRIDDLEKRLAEIAGRPQFDDKMLDGIAERFVTLDEKIAAIESRGNRAQAGLTALETRIKEIENKKIPVQILDVDGNVIDTETYPLGAPIQLRLTPRPK